MLNLSGNSIKLLYSLFTVVLFCQNSMAQSSKIKAISSINSENQKDSVKLNKEITSFSHHLALEYRPAWVIPSSMYNNELYINPFNKFEQSGHLKYAFSLPKASLGNLVFPNTQQGIGFSIYDFGNAQEIGTPIVAYLFQRSQITIVSPRFSLDYEWNFGISTGWKPYDLDNNPNNVTVGSKVNAFISLGTSLNWKLANRISLFGGVDFTHFSNGNTKYPNAGVNLLGGKIGVVYDVSKTEIQSQDDAVLQRPKFTRHVSYDLVAFGSWRRKGVDFLDQHVASPHQYPVVGAYFAPMFNWSYRLRTGFSVDAIYDGSANVYTEDYIVGTEQQFFKPEWDQQVALGVSARVDYVMPLFTINLGIGTQAFHKGKDLKGTYQALSLKIRATKNSFFNIGYSVKDFHEPNYLMFGIGYLFNNKTPQLLLN